MYNRLSYLILFLLQLNDLNEALLFSVDAEDGHVMCFDCRADGEKPTAGSIRTSRQHAMDAAYFIILELRW
jgi:hypothetical protein